ncbi:MAG: PQQ-dependent sugar dehydrogenase [Bryobacteraceae bacterium]
MSMRILLPTTAILLTLAAMAAEIKLPPPYHTPSSTNRPRVIPQPDGSALRVPAGFTAEKFADGFTQPRIMILGPSGEILLSDSKGGTIYVIQPGRKKLIENLDRPYGMAFHKDWLYVAEPTSVKRYRYDKAGMRVALPGEEVINMKDFGKGHWTRCILFDKAGSKLYVGIGSGSNVDHGEPSMRAAINRFNPDGSGQEIYAAGTRNPTMIRWYPGSQSLWVAVQERDALGDDLVPDYFTAVKQGGFYGWPYAYIGPNGDPRRNEKPDLVNKTLAPDLVLGAHVAVLDFLFYTGKQFPKEYHGGAFLAFHGSWNRSKRVGQSIAYVPFKNGKPAGEPREFLTGWMMGPDKAEVWGRPVGLLQMKDGSLLASEDGNGTIWRISYKGN